MSTPPDPISLDAILTGVDDDLETWERLVSSPNAHEVWDDAVKRRRELEEFTDLLFTYPAIARIRRVARKVLNDATQLPALALVRELGPAHLGPSLEVADRHLPLTWGEVDVVAVPLGETVEMSIDPSRSDLAFWARTGTTAQRLENPAWTLEPGEAPVVLLAAAGLGDVSPFDEAKQAAGIAGVVLIEAREAPAE